MSSHFGFSIVFDLEQKHRWAHIGSAKAADKVNCLHTFNGTANGLVCGAVIVSLNLLP